MRSTDAITVSMSSGLIVRRSITSQSMPSPASCSAAASESCTPFMTDTIVRSEPARAMRACAERQRLVADLALDAEQPLVLQEEHGVVVADRLLEQALRVARGRRAGDLEPRHRVEPADRRLRVDRAEATAGAHDREHDERHARLLVREVPVLRALVDDAVHDERQEVAEHDLDHGTLAGHGAAEGRADQRELRDRACRTPAPRRTSRPDPASSRRRRRRRRCPRRRGSRSRRARAPRPGRRGRRRGTRPRSDR